jgi:hypothetical protein
VGELDLLGNYTRLNHTLRSKLERPHPMDDEHNPLVMLLAFQVVERDLKRLVANFGKTG